VNPGANEISLNRFLSEKFVGTNSKIDFRIWNNYLLNNLSKMLWCARDFLGDSVMSHHPVRKAVDFCSVTYFGINRIGFTEVYIEACLIQ